VKILYFNNGSGLGTAKSGGTTRLIETARRMMKSGASVSIVTTLGALRLFKSENLIADYILVRAALFAKSEKSNFGRMSSYLISTIHAIVVIPRLPV